MIIPWNVPRIMCENTTRRLENEPHAKYDFPREDKPGPLFAFFRALKSALNL